MPQYTKIETKDKGLDPGITKQIYQGKLFDM